MYHSAFIVMKIEPLIKSSKYIWINPIQKAPQNSGVTDSDAMPTLKHIHSLKNQWKIIWFN